MRQTKEWRAQNPAIDYMRPIIADADTGHGGYRLRSRTRVHITLSFFD